MAGELEAFLAKHQAKTTRTPGQYKAFCPVCKRHELTMTLDPTTGKIVLYCHSGWNHNEDRKNRRQGAKFLYNIDRQKLRFNPDEYLLSDGTYDWPLWEPPVSKADQARKRVLLTLLLNGEQMPSQKMKADVHEHIDVSPRTLSGVLAEMRKEGLIDYSQTQESGESNAKGIGYWIITEAGEDVQIG